MHELGFLEYLFGFFVSTTVGGMRVFVGVCRGLRAVCVGFVKGRV